MSLLYHYTSQPGLLGIFASKSIWATNTHFLNDPTEFVHALASAKSVANYFFESDYFEAFGAMLYEHLESVKGKEIYVASFSEKPDLLSQWRGYCPGGSGYCLGFDRDALAAYCEKFGMRLEKCLYGHGEQQSEVASVISGAMDFFPTIPITVQEFHALPSEQKVECMFKFRQYLSEEGEGQAKSAISEICEALLEMAPRFKNEGFYEEAEWRIIAQNPPQAVQFRVGPSYVIPHISLDILKGNLHALQKVIVGPNPNQSRAVKAIELMVKASGYRPDIVTASNIPFNNW